MKGLDSMENIYAAMGSITTATRLSRELSRRGIAASVVHTPSEVNSGGCSYSVRVPLRSREALEQAAAARKLTIRRLYMGSEEGYRDLS